jgi:hypothetical protein
MVRQTNLTGAESCWEDDADSEADCEKFLQKAARATINTAADEDDEDEEDEDEEDEEEDAEDASDDENADVGNEADESVTVTATLPAADADDSSESLPEAAHSKGKKMAKAKAGGKTKADSIREVIAARQAAGKDLRPKDIIEALEKKGIEVNASQVSITLRAMGVPALRKGAGAKAKTPVAAEANDEEPTKSRPALKTRAAIDSSSDDSAAGELSHTSELLENAADFMHAAGGYERAKAVLDMCHRVIQRS